MQLRSFVRSIAAIAAIATVSLAQVSYFSASLDSAQEVPPNGSTGRGWSVVRFDAGTSNVRIFVFYEGLTGAPTAAHLHQAAPGVNGPIVVPLAGAGGNVFTGTMVLAPAVAVALTGGQTYVNVHTALNPGGEIRGQVVTSASTRFTGVMTGAQEVPPTPSTATGTIVAFLHEPDNRMTYVVESNGLVNVTAAHIHIAPALSNGPIIVPLNGANGRYCGVSGKLTAAQMTAAMSDGLYANIHTAANPGGEIRAQLLKDAGDHFLAVLSGANEVPPTPTPAQGSGSVIIGPDGTAQVHVEWGGLLGAYTASHIHTAPVGINGPVTFGLTQTSATTSDGTWTPTSAQVTTLRSGGMYINVHSSMFPGGEIRGQLLPAALPTTFGGGCPGSNNVRPEIGATGFAAVGQPVRIDLFGALPAAAAVVALGFNRDFGGPGGGLPLPAEFTSLGLPAPNCFFLIDPASTALVFTNPLGCAGQTLGVPLNVALRGALVYAQWFPFDGAANPFGIVTSNALTLAIQ